MTDQWVITGRTVTQDGLVTTIEITTDKATILRVCTLSTQPARVPITRIRRGAPVICGYQLHYASPVCYDQEQPGPTTEHTFSIPTPDNLTETWAVVTEPPEPSYGLQTSVPWVLTPDVIVPALPTICLIRSTDLIVGNSGSSAVPWESIRWQRGWPYTLADPVHVPWPANGYVQLVFQVPWQAASNTAIWLELATNAPPRFIRDVRGTNQAGQSNLQELTGIVHATAGDVIQATLRSDGTANMQTQIGGVQVMYLAMHYLSFD